MLLSQLAIVTKNINIKNRSKRKDKRKIKKKRKLQPLIKIFNNTLANFNIFISIRQVLKHNKIDIT